MVSAYKQAVTPWGMDSIRGKIHKDMLCQSSHSIDTNMQTHTTMLSSERQRYQTHQHLKKYPALMGSFPLSHAHEHVHYLKSLSSRLMKGKQYASLMSSPASHCWFTLILSTNYLTPDSRTQTTKKRNSVPILYMCVCGSRERNKVTDSKEQSLVLKRKSFISSSPLQLFFLSWVGEWILSRGRWVAHSVRGRSIQTSLSE